MKLNAANKLCLGGVLIWAVDLDGVEHASSKDLQGLGAANGVSSEDAAEVKNLTAIAARAATIENSCYWTFCGENCGLDFVHMAYSKGKVPGIASDVGCTGDEYRSLCCVPGTTSGQCSWHGWRGVGMPCVSDYCPSGSEIIAANSKLNESLIHPQCM